MRRAKMRDAAALDRVLRLASLNNPGDRDFLLAHPEVMTLDRALLGAGRVELIESREAVLGFATLLLPVGELAELDGIFVLPSHSRSGLGSALMRAVCSRAREEGALAVHALVNPHALAFYQALGFADAVQAGVAAAPEVQAGLAYAMVRAL